MEERMEALEDKKCKCKNAAWNISF
jgi:hypothetical protein